ncbi:MAG: bifunctional folylpolyglutamate synthase/dihydrofolate synthase [Lachnospiraceae bacterium]|nr:bifunctional folylpolyglutamate synthase/dihydrofolate synthase [Lachnospiraceae bacterium]
MGKVTTYDEAIEYINAIGQKGSILGLGPVTELLSRLGNPQEKLNIIHVAGTNGKGSICTFLEMLYREEGKRVGRYISPTIHDYLERFQINGEMMAEDVFARLLAKVEEAVYGMGEEGCGLPTAFEIETAVAFMYFVEEKVDIVILEVGMGGREDATNVIKHPLCTVFANIGMDHMQFLGDTIEKIAYEKAGIIKAGCPAVSYPSDERALNVLRKEYEAVNSVNTEASEGGPDGAFNKKDEKNGIVTDGQEDEMDSFVSRIDKCIDAKQMFTVADISKLQILSESLEVSTFIYKGEEYSISLAGTYQIYNAVTAIETKLMLDGHLVKEALLKARWEGRFQKICDEPLFIKDGAHNVQGVEALKDSLKLHFTNACFIFIIGVLKDKEYEKMMEIMCPMAKACYLIKPQNARGLDTYVLTEVVSRYCEDVTRCVSVDEAVDMAVDKWREMTSGFCGRDANSESADADYHSIEEAGYSSDGNVVIVAWGSLSYIGDVVLNKNVKVVCGDNYRNR